MANEHTITITGDGNWDSDVVQSDVPVLIDFWAEWCGPCKALGPTIDEVAEKLSGRAKVAKVDIDHSDENRGIATKHGVRGIPSLMIYKGGEKVAQVTDRSLGGLVAALEEHM